MALNSSFWAKNLLGIVHPEDIDFRLFTDEDVRKLSITKIVSRTSFDIMGNPTPGGLYDSAMGPSQKELCGTCNNTALNCPGHIGHIELPVCVINPLFLKKIYTLFRMSCLKCYKIQLNDYNRRLLDVQMSLVDAGHITAALDLNDHIREFKDKEEHGLTKKVLKKYLKLLAKEDNVTRTFQNKNSSVIRTKIWNNYFKMINITKTCVFCKSKMIKILTNENKLMYNKASDSRQKGAGLKILLPDEIKEICGKIAKNDGDILIKSIPILKYINIEPVTDAFFMEVLPVLPPIVRPCNFLKGELLEHPQTHTYKTVLSVSFTIRTILQVLSSQDPQKAIDSLDATPRQAYQSAQGKNPAEKLHNAWQELQKSVLQVLDCEGLGATSLGLKQVIERKTGIIRMHMMGKRVNFAARSVITPDPNVDIDEIGIPDVFAKKLTYPVSVTEYNVDMLRKMVINGPLVHPGAELIEIENGRTILIPPYSKEKRESIAKRLLTPDEFKSSGHKIVHRHLLNGDVLILNRQPSLHKPSMMAHRARILKGEKTLRLHYSNCKSYNADFDGDEMNAHFPQNEIARSEAYNIMSVCKQYLVPKDGTPLGGLIQDHVIAGVKLSLRGTFVNKSDYHQLVFQALANRRGKIKLLPPTILKPVMLWSGKQVLSTIIINNIPKDKPYLTLESTAKISAKAWQKEPPRPWKAGGTQLSNLNEMTEAEVIIRKGELLCGVLDKTHYGATPYGLVHCMFELYGGASSCALLSSFSKVFSYYLQWAGFTLGVKDILVVNEAEKERDELIFLVRQSGKIAATKATELAIDLNDDEIKNAIEENLIKDPKFRASLDRNYKSILDTYTNKINTACLSQGLLEKFPYNNLQLMVQSGAKGSTVNTMQISCLLGQIELEGKRPPIMISGKTLPSFPPFDLSPRAGGFIDGRFMTGIQPQEFFFHCMAGREGLIDTAVKTSRSGYLQRCLIKHLESLSVGYDHTVRDSDGSLIQIQYGEDGLDILKCQYLKEKQLEFLDVNADAVANKAAIKKLKNDDDIKSSAKSKKSLKKWVKKFGSPLEKSRMCGFTIFSNIVKKDITLGDITDNSRDPYYFEIEKRWRELSDEEKCEYERKKCPEPIQSTSAPNFMFGAINEQLENIMSNYLKNRKETQFRQLTEKSRFMDIMYAKYLESMADPGEPVGLLAAQSIGEPSTQMTLNTFHFAGRGDMNVTLGIPRLREILMTASANLKTPNMEIPFRTDIENSTKKAENLRRKLNKVTVADVLEKIDIECKLVVNPDRQLKTTMKFAFLPHSQYKTQYSVKPAEIIKHMQKKFFAEMFSTIKKQVKSSGGIVWAENKTRKRKVGEADDYESEKEDDPVKSKNRKADDDSSDEDEVANDEDADNTDAKLRSKRLEEQEYEDPEPEEEVDDEDEEKTPDAESEATSKTKEPEKELSEKDIKAMEDVVSSHRNASNYSFDTKNHRWCELTVLFPISFLKIDMTQALREAATKSVIYEVKNIKRAITVTEKGNIILKTEGINIIKIFGYDDILDVNRLYSNDVHAIANTYGIEAATKVIIKEIKNVFGVYGISVDLRHLSLIADYMTYNGVFEPMSRKGMESATSPLQQMSFESSIVFLKEAVLNAKSDDLRAASSCLMIGKPCQIGTGCFSVQASVK